VVHYYSGDKCTILFAAKNKCSGWFTQHLPIGTNIISHDGVLDDIDGVEIEPGTIPHRFLFNNVDSYTVTYQADKPLSNVSWYWVAHDGEAHFGYN